MTTKEQSTTRRYNPLPDFRLECVDGSFWLTMPHLGSRSADRQGLKFLVLDEGGRTSIEGSVNESEKRSYMARFAIVDAILKLQEGYFRSGDETMLRPMSLSDLSKILGRDISTISRMISSKTIETPYGTFPVKYFFSEGLENQAGEAVSSRELKMVIKNCVETEDKRHPLTDDNLAEEMKRRGYLVARRTIAKYREQLGIPKASLRKNMSVGRSSRGRK